ncbi:carbamoyltransferase HypF [Thermofilum pendens]|uniref:Carbamoyltransferase n=1 Tax=Thermofilum pendens (strain DSM 2475 / Hrk 5) TaxID=368408 RepID=A1RWZ7_THEPD|nr:carbamoyltransferase HypF [Thermofilum pendens]ABL77727.1 (NiFe) hydrogenase maturation protein HypF [Thermofilum pendens Hrk 5]
MRAWRIRVTGVVQGVGFRPHVYRLAKKYGLRGYVQNLGGSEVEIWVEGEETLLRSFLEDLKLKTPRSAELDEVVVEEVEPSGFSDFAILRSGTNITKVSMIPPDFGICDDCLREVLDPSSRWYRYPFHSCAWCGPRFSVIERIPYDRENTSMRHFPLCPDCLEEYGDPGNIRRFHIQGISCPNCGPQVYLVDGRGSPVNVKDPIVEAARLIDEGSIVAVKGIGGFHLACLATDDDVLRRLRDRKKRPRKPFAVMALDLKVAERIAVLDENAKSILSSPARPILILPRVPGSLSELVAPGLRTVGVMLAYSALHYLLLSATRDKYLVMTSGNESGEPIIKDNEEALRKLSGIADYFLMHNRRIVNRVDDSVVRFTDGETVLIRRSRGYAPKWLPLPRPVRVPALSTGAFLMNTGSIAVEKYVITTQHIGDLENLETYNFLIEALEFLKRTYGVSDCDAVPIVDKHPYYLSRRVAEELSAKCSRELVEVQHHVAHVAAAMLEAWEEDAVGIAIDGVGYGDDGQAWGGEVLRVGREGYERLGHLDYVPLPGGDRATYYPARILVGVAGEVFGCEEAAKIAEANGLENLLPGGRQELLLTLKQLGSAPKASSAGRFLDAVAAALKVSWERSYEGEPAITLEEYSWGGSLIGDSLLEREEGVVLTKDFLARLLTGEVKGHPRDLAYTVQFLLGRRLAEIALESGARKVYVAGGSAVNTVIIKGIKSVLGGENVYIPRKLPPGDNGISAGQIYYAYLVDYV